MKIRRGKPWWIDLFILAFILLVFLAVLAQVRGQRNEPTPATGPRVEWFADGKWVLLYHESGTQYMIRSSAIIGLADNVGGQRNELMLSGGKNLQTTMSPKQFAKLVEDIPGG